MTTLDSMIYLSNGKMPSQWAHSIQVAKMSQAYAAHLKQFELVTSGSLTSAFRGMDESFKQWYGLRQTFKVVRIPAHWKTDRVFPANYYSARYYKLAILYSYFKQPNLVKTRTQNPAVMKLLHQAGLPVLWEHHEQIKPESHLCKFFHYPNLVGVVTISPYLAENFMTRGLPADRVIVVPSGVDLESFQPERSKAEARQQLALDPTAKLVVYSGHLYDYKGIPTILAVAKLMPNCQFLLVGGWAEDIDRVRQTVQTQGLTNVGVVGHIPQTDLATYLYAADVLLLPTSQSWALSEVTSPLKLFEYMAVKRPIVSSDLPTIRTVLRDQENGRLVEPDEPIAFQAAIAHLLDSPEVARTLAERAYETVQAFTWEKRAAKILEFAAQRLAHCSQEKTSNSFQFLRSVQASF